MDSSPDLSLKLRRGSSDSRDSFYMDFAQGIDSDIEDVVTQASGGALPAPPYQQQQTDTGSVTTPGSVTLVPITASSTASIPDITILSGGPAGSICGASEIIPEDLEEDEVLPLEEEEPAITGVQPPVDYEEDIEDMDDLEPVPPPMPDLADHTPMVLPLPPLPSLDIDDRLVGASVLMGKGGDGEGSFWTTVKWK